MTSWSRGDLVVIPGVVVDESDEAGDVRVTVEAPDRGAVGLPTQMIYCVPDNALRRADDGVADAIRERDEARSERDAALESTNAALRAINALRADCDGLRAVADEYKLKLREARARDDAAVAHEALAERDEAKQQLDAALRLIGERALREYMDGGER